MHAREPQVSRFRMLVVLLFSAVASPVGLIIVLLLDEGISQPVYGAMLACFTFLGIAAVKTLVVPRRARAIEPDETGEVTIISPVLIFLPVTCAFLALYPILVLGPWWLLTDAQNAPRGRLILIVGVLVCMTPDLVRLLTGRLYRWRLILNDDTVTYRGYRTTRTVPWTKVRSVHIDDAWPGTVVIRTKGTKEPDIVVQYRAFDVPAAQFLDEINSRLRAARR